jgi:hypothetical protein
MKGKYGMEVVEWRGQTLVTKRALELDAPFSFGPVQLEHGNAHDENHQGCNKFKDAYLGIRQFGCVAERGRIQTFPEEFSL